MTDDVAAALAFVDEFNGDGRCSLNCHHSEVLAREVRRLTALVEAQERRWVALKAWYDDVRTVINVGTVGEKLRDLDGGTT